MPKALKSLPTLNNIVMCKILKKIFSFSHNNFTVLNSYISYNIHVYDYSYLNIYEQIMRVKVSKRNANSNVVVYLYTNHLKCYGLKYINKADKRANYKIYQ